VTQRLRNYFLLIMQPFRCGSTTRLFQLQFINRPNQRRTSNGNYDVWRMAGDGLKKLMKFKLWLIAVTLGVSFSRRRVCGPRRLISSPVLSSHGNVPLSDKPDIRARWNTIRYCSIDRPSRADDAILDSIPHRPIHRGLNTMPIIMSLKLQ